jgi:Fe-S cluster biogenesis protein NfuA
VATPATGRVAQVEALLDRLDALPDAAARETATATVQALLALYGEGLRAVVERVGPAQARALAQDELVSHLLLLHGLHPVPVEQRVRDALAGVRPYLESHGGDVELLGVAEGVVRLRLEGSCEGCPASAMTLKLAIEEAVRAAAPDVERVEAEGVDDPAHAALLQIECSPALAATARPEARAG